MCFLSDEVRKKGQYFGLLVMKNISKILSLLFL